MQPLIVGVILAATYLCNWDAAAAQSLPADPSGAALEAAAADLATYPARYSDVPGRSPFAVADRSVLERATLGVPFRWYWPDSTFDDYENDEPTSLLRHLRNMCVSFPVHSDGRILGTINVQFRDDGSQSITRFVGEEGVKQFNKHAATAPVGPGQRVSIIQARIGEYAVVEDGAMISKMIRLDSAEGTAWLSPEEAAPAIKSAISKQREARRKWEERLRLHPLPKFSEDR